jgi:hypothetical protein
MSDTKQQITTALVIQIGGILVALSLGWAVMDARGQAAQAAITDHETRLRGLEREVLVKRAVKTLASAFLAFRLSPYLRGFETARQRPTPT